VVLVLSIAPSINCRGKLSRRVRSRSRHLDEGTQLSFNRPTSGDANDEAALMPRQHRSMISLNTLARPHSRGYRLFGSCCDCAKLYRMDAPAQQRISSTFDIDLDKLIEERGAETSCVRRAPVRRPRCGGLRTEYRITTPK
jgi:hypothetical protein